MIKLLKTKILAPEILIKIVILKIKISREFHPKIRNSE